MREYMHKQNLPDAATVLSSGVVPLGRVRHQIDFSGTTGSVNIDIDWGNGFRRVETVDLSNSTRLPFCIEGAARDVRITPTIACTLAYYFDYV